MKKEKETLADEDVVPIPIKEFVSGSIVPVDLFIRLSATHYVLVAKAGMKTQIDQIASYENRRVDYLFVRKTDYKKYVNQNITIAGIILNNAQLEKATKATFLHKAQSSVLKEIEDLGFNHDSYEHAKIVTQSTVQLVEAKIDLTDILKSLSETGQGLVAHSTAVSLTAVMVGKILGWQNRSVLEKLALGGLLHDIGKKELPKSILEKPRAKLTYDEVILYESHPYRGLQILESIGQVPDDVLAIVNEHHENAIGQGFPRRLRDLRMNPLAKVVALCNTFCELCLPHNPNIVPRPPKEALDHIKTIMGQPYNKPAFRAMVEIVESAKKQAA